jgi:predicted amidohydrolase YtcJ
VVGHNYGDLSADHYMDMLDDLINKDGYTLDYIRSRRLSMDHCGVYPRPDQLPRMKKFGIYLSCGSGELTRSWPWVEKYGLKYQDWVSPVKSALDAGIRVVFETEGYVTDGLFTSFTPFITRKNDLGKLVSPQNAVDRNVVIKMATSWSAEYVLKEDKIGTLAKGKWADFLVLNKDYFTVPVEEIDTIYPIVTVVGGKIRYARADAAPALGIDPVGAQIRYGWETGKQRRLDPGN